ncbi:MAG: hypothetical protein ACREDH_12170 [Methylocella sp.]
MLGAWIIQGGAWALFVALALLTPYALLNAAQTPQGARRAAGGRRRDPDDEDMEDDE